MSHQRRRSHRTDAGGGPGEDLLLGLSEGLLARAVLYVSPDDACRLKAVCRKLDVSLGKLVCFGQHHRLPAKPRGLHWWSCLERRTRGCDKPLTLADVPALALAFGIAAPDALQQQQQQQQLDDSDADAGDEDVIQAAEEEDADHSGGEQQQQSESNDADASEDAGEEEEEEEDAHGAGNSGGEQQQCTLQVLTAAALFGGWWGPSAEPHAARGCKRALKLVEAYLGPAAAEVVLSMLKNPACPAAARGFWGTLLLGMLASSTSAAAVGGGAKLAERLLKMAARAANSSNSSSSSSSSSTRSNGDSSSRASWRKVPVPVPDTTPWETPAAAAAAAAGDDSRSEAEEDADASRLWLPCSDDEEDEGCGAAADGGCLRYHVVEWLSALLVLLRMAPLRRKGLQEAAALQELHYSVLQELLLQEAREADAAAAALVGMPGPQQQQQQLSSSELAAAAGLPAGCRLTGEQLRIVRQVVVGPGSSNALVTINAFAGTAKSTTLKLLMHANPGEVFLYTAYNRAVVDDARSSAPRHVDCKTTHQLAGPSRVEMLARPGWKLGNFTVEELWSRLADVPYYQQLGKRPPRQVAAAVKETLDKFVTSADRRVRQKHVPKVLEHLSDPPDYVEVAQQMWEAIVDNTCRPMRFTHNCYLKQFSDALVDSSGILRNWRGEPYIMILIDEAQDVNPVTLQMLLSQPCMRVLVGDRHQHIYSFNFCANALENAAAAAAAAGRPSRVRCYSLSSSFRLGPAVAAVANKLLWQLGERKRPLVGVGWQHAAVYRQVTAANNQQAPAAAAAAAAAAAGGGEGRAEAGEAADAVHFEQIQLLQQQTTTERTPGRLESLTLMVETRDGPQQLHLALPPVDPNTGKRKPLWYVTRYNKTWVEAAAALVLPERQVGSGFSSPAAATPSSRLAGTPGTGARNNSGAAAARAAAAAGGNGSSGSLRRNLFGVPVVAAAAAAFGSRGRQAVLEQDEEEDKEEKQQQQQNVAYGSQLSSQGSNNALLNSPAFSRVGSQLSTPQQQQQQRYQVPKLYLTATANYSGAVEFLENVLGVFKLKYYGTRFRQYTSWDELEKAAERREDADLLGAIGLVRKYKQHTCELVDAIKRAKVSDKSEADFILGTCHRAKGCEEDYVQLADDYAPIAAGRQPHVEVDEYNLLYVAATRAKLALIVNPDLEKLLLNGSHRPLLLQVADDTDDQDEQQAVKPVAEAAAAAAATARGLLSIALVPKPLQLGMPIMYGAEPASRRSQD